MFDPIAGGGRIGTINFTKNQFLSRDIESSKKLGITFEDGFGTASSTFYYQDGETPILNSINIF